ncbi:hypothetical protein F2Q68_00008553 [Brassica cretica]|uniref:Uncharacterized protein n=1 Tax=Brassica cretica TaxID=69181 RepID=A0A8S9L401_BRACR|nr:hypothetical protein F2Q68_00008553 [Brassica cretica]
MAIWAIRECEKLCRRLENMKKLCGRLEEMRNAMWAIKAHGSMYEGDWRPLAPLSRSQYLRDAGGSYHSPGVGVGPVSDMLEDGGGKRVLLGYNSVGINSITKRKDEEEVKEEKKEEEEEKEKEEEEEEDAAGDGHLWWPGSADLDIHEMSGGKMVTIA